MIALGIVVVNLIILIWVSFLIYKRIDTYLSKNQTKEKGIKQKIIIQDKKTSFRNIINSIFLAGLAIIFVAPFHYIAKLVFHLLFPLPIKGTIATLFAIIYFNIWFLIYFVLLISAWKWLKKNINLSDLKIKKNKKNDKQKSILKADPKTRRIAIIALFIFVIFVLALFMWVLPEFNEFLIQKQREERLRILSIALSISFLTLLLVAAYLYYFGHRILKAGQVPWPGAKVWRDTEITTGDEAHRIGRILKVISFSLALTSLYCAIYFYYSSDKFVLFIKKFVVFIKGIF